MQGPETTKKPGAMHRAFLILQYLKRLNQADIVLTRFARRETLREAVLE